MGGDAAALGVALDEMRRELAAGEGSLQVGHAYTHVHYMHTLQAAYKLLTTH